MNVETLSKKSMMVLRSLAKYKGLSTQGRKAELIERILAAPSTSEKLKLPIQNKKKASSLKMSNPTHILIYTGVDLGEQPTIVQAFANREDAFVYMKLFAVVKSVPPKMIATDADLYEVMEDHFHLSLESFESIKLDPSRFGNWDSESLWALVNHDFSKVDLSRWKKLEKEIDWPVLEEEEEEEEEEEKPVKTARKKVPKRKAAM